jgi:hypothetical protein
VPKLAPDSIWVEAVSLGACGQYADSAELLRPLTARADRWASLALSTLASHRRQVGDVTEAAGLDAAALREATDAESRADALIGLAADAVAGGDPQTAAVHHRDAERDAHALWRTLTRWHWVGAELALLTDDRMAAQAHAQAALAACLGHSARHEAKSRIVLAAVTGDLGELARVSATVEDAGWATLSWPLALVAADHAGTVPPPWLVTVWQEGRHATEVIEAGLAASDRAAWRAHPGVRRLREEWPPSGGG